MNDFEEALIFDSKSSKIPEEYNFFGQFVGTWSFEWIDHKGTEQERHVNGEWIFSWILEGTAIQDIFICPSRIERSSNPQQDAEYGTTVRIYNPQKQAWDIFYGCTGEASLLEARKENETIVLTAVNYKDFMMKWIFSEISENSFHWRHIKSVDGGETWETKGELFAKRKV